MSLPLQLFSGAAHTRLTITNDPARRVDPAGFDKRPQSENHRGWIAPRIGDESGCRQRLRIQFWKSVHGFLQNFSCGRGGALPTREFLGLVKTERSAQIHDSQLWIRREQLWYELERCFVRCREKCYIGAASRNRRNRQRPARCLSPAAQLRIEFRQAAHVQAFPESRR